MRRKIKNRSGDRVCTISVMEGIFLRITDDALKGNVKSASFFLNRFGAMVSGEPERTDLTAAPRNKSAPEAKPPPAKGTAGHAFSVRKPQTTAISWSSWMATGPTRSACWYHRSATANTTLSLLHAL
jgi:hypothetical protein